MNLQEIKDRYFRARENATRAIDDLDQGADPVRVYEAVETAILWKLMWATEGKQLAVNLDVFDAMMGPTNGHDEDPDHLPVYASLPRDEAQRRSNHNARKEREREERDAEG